MPRIEFSREEKDLLAGQLKAYCSNELDVELGQFDAEFLLDFISEQLGAHYYNLGIRDAGALLATKLDDLHDALYEIEMPITPPRR